MFSHHYSSKTKSCSNLWPWNSQGFHAEERERDGCQQEGLSQCILGLCQMPHPSENIGNTDIYTDIAALGYNTLFFFFFYIEFYSLQSTVTIHVPTFTTGPMSLEGPEYMKNA